MQNQISKFSCLAQFFLILLLSPDYFPRNYCFYIGLLNMQFCIYMLIYIYLMSKFIENLFLRFVKHGCFQLSFPKSFREGNNVKIFLSLLIHLIWHYPYQYSCWWHWSTIKKSSSFLCIFTLLLLASYKWSSEWLKFKALGKFLTLCFQRFFLLPTCSACLSLFVCVA